MRDSEVHRIPSTITTSAAGNGPACRRTSGLLDTRRAAGIVMCTAAQRIRYSGSRQSTAADVCDMTAPPVLSRATAMTCAR